MEHNGQDLAIKRMRSCTSVESRITLQERLCKLGTTWKKLKHPHVLTFLGIDAEPYPQTLCLIFPWMQNGTILDYMDKKDPQNDIAKKLILEVAEGMSYLHSRNLIHGNLKSTNVLIDGEGHANIADAGLIDNIFGISSMTTATQLGSMRWTAPELLTIPDINIVPQRTPATDVYSFSFLCMEVYTGHYPFFDIPAAIEVSDMVIKGIRPQRPDHTSRIAMSDEVWTMVEACWNHQPSERPTSEHIILDLKKI